MIRVGAVQSKGNIEGRRRDTGRNCHGVDNPLTTRVERQARRQPKRSRTDRSMPSGDPPKRPARNHVDANEHLTDPQDIVPDGPGGLESFSIPATPMQRPLSRIGDRRREDAGAAQVRSRDG